MRRKTSTSASRMPGLAWRKSTLRAGTRSSFMPSPPSMLKLLEQTEVELPQRRQDQVRGLQAAVVLKRRIGYRDAAPGCDVQASGCLDVDAGVRFSVLLVLGRLRDLEIRPNAEGIQYGRDDLA